MFISKDISWLSENGRFLHIDMRPVLDVHLKYALWENGLTLYRQNCTGWEIENQDPNLPLLNPLHESDPDLPVHVFIRSIPADIRNAVSRFDHLQTKLLQLLALSSAARDLLHDIPLLLWIVADYAQEPNVTKSSLEALLKKRRVDILLETLFRDSSEADVRFLKKISLSNFFNRQLNYIQHYIYDGRAHDFRNWQEIPYHALEILKNQRDLVSCEFIKRLAIGDHNTSEAVIPHKSVIITLINDTLRMGRNLGIADPMHIINKCDTIAALHRLHDKWVKKFNNREIFYRSRIQFPEPPIPGNAAIQPIRNEGELLLEGRRMHHCVGGHNGRIHQGISYIYQVFEPERATVEIIGRGLAVRMGQFMMACNKRPSAESHLKVHQWIEDFKKTL
jgi:hypothetical protein